jgi:antitoxin YefM
MLIPNQQQFTLEYAYHNLHQVIECAKTEAVILTKNEEKFFLINQEALESWLETLILLQDQELLHDIDIAKKEYQTGETLTMDDIFN